MSEYLIQKVTLEAIGEAIREKTLSIFLNAATYPEGTESVTKTQI